MAIPVVTPLPTAPSRSRPTTFSAEGDVFLGALENTFTPQLNAVVAAMNIDTAIVNQKTADASISSQSAAASAAAALSNSTAVPWVSNTAYPSNTVVISQINFQAYRKTTGAGGSSADPSTDNTNWVALGTSTLVSSPRVADVQLVRNDTGKFITSAATFTQTFNTASALGSGWYVLYTVTGFGAVTILGTTYRGGWVGLVQCNGTSLSVITLKNSTGYMKISQREAAGVGGGAATDGATVIRNLNTVETNTILTSSLSGNTVFLNPGSYRIFARAPAGGNSRLSFGGITGSNTQTNSNEGNMAVATLFGYLTVTTNTGYTLNQYFEDPSPSSSVNTVLGFPMGSAVNIYAELEITKVD